MTTYEELLKMSVELATLSPNLRQYVKELHVENSRLRRELGMRKLIDDIRTDEANLDASVSMFHRPQA